MKGFRQALNAEKVIGRQPGAVRRQNSGADGEAGTRVKKCRRADTGQRVEPVMPGSGIRRRLPCVAEFSSNEC